MVDWPRDDHAMILNQGANVRGQIQWQFAQGQLGKLQIGEYSERLILESVKQLILFENQI